MNIIHLQILMVISHCFLVFGVVRRNRKLLWIPNHLFIPVCLYVSLKDCGIFSLSPKAWSFMNFKVWVHFIHCSGYSVRTFNLLTHVLSSSYFTGYFLPIWALLSFPGPLIILILALLKQSSNFLYFSFILNPFVFLFFYLESSWIFFFPTLWVFISAIIF